MLVSLPTSDLLNSIYASSALATLTRDCHTALLHPDHADALVYTLRDALAALAAAAPDGCIKVINTSQQVFNIELPHADDPITAPDTLRLAITSTATSIIASAAGLQPLPTIPDSLISPFLPRWEAGTIERA